jgi:Fe-S oxidoreductase
MNEIDRVFDNCIECGLCLEECDFLQKHCASPRELAVEYKENGFVNTPAIPYSCNICTLCELRCPHGLDTGKMIFEMRKEMVLKDIGPLPQHKPAVEGQQFYVSDDFKVIIPSPEKYTDRIFFPGCALSAYSPALVIKTYEYLKEKLPGTGIMLGCCGGPSYLLGDMNTFEPISKDIAFQMREIGSSQIITACPFCYSLLKQNHPGLNPVMLYKVLDEIGIPSHNHKAVAYNIHDPCSARYETQIHESVRSIVRKAGHEVIEIPHSKTESHCCGMGGMAYVADAELGKLRSERTLRETSCDIITYCATCRETLQGQGGHVVHLLDIIFNRRLKSASNITPKTPQQFTNNMKRLKKELVA